MAQFWWRLLDLGRTHSSKCSFLCCVLNSSISVLSFLCKSYYSYSFVVVVFLLPYLFHFLFILFCFILNFFSSIFSAHFSFSLLLSTPHPPHSASLSLEQQDKPFSIFYKNNRCSNLFGKGKFQVPYFPEARTPNIILNKWHHSLYTVRQRTFLASLYLLHLPLCTELPNSK